MKPRILLWLCAGALLASTALNVVFAERLHRGCGVCGTPSPAEVQDCIECLGLSADQCASLRAQSPGCCEPVAAAERGGDAVLAELQQALQDEKVDEAHVRALGEELAARHGAAIAAGVEAALRMRAVLTKEQVAALARRLGQGGR